MFIKRNLIKMRSNLRIVDETEFSTIMWWLPCLGAAHTRFKYVFMTTYLQKKNTYNFLLSKRLSKTVRLSLAVR